MSFGSPSYTFPEPEDGEEWRDTPFAGDFYRPPDDVVRGLTLTSAGAGFGDSGFGDNGFLGTAALAIDKGQSLGTHPGLDPTPFDASMFYSSRPLGGSATADTFQDGDCPPNAPSDSFFKLEATTLSVLTDPRFAFEIGNHLLGFLNDEVVSVPSKVNRKKFSMKADVFAESMMCTIKIRVYMTAFGQFAIEFQRRAGDSIVFNGTFQQASEYLKSRLTLASAPDLAALSNKCWPLIPKGSAGACVSEAALAPLLDMASLADAPSLQADAAASLAEMAAQGDPRLCDLQVFQGISELLRARSVEVAFPTARLVNHLAQRADAAALLSTQGLLSQVRERAEAPETPARVREQLELALRAATQRQHP